MPQTILIAGGGIGGLTTGLALRRAGFEVRVFERASRIGEVGAGLTVQSNAILALQRIGLDQDVIGNGQVLGAASVRRPDGTLISRADLAEVGHAVGAPAVAIHRATLLAITPEEAILRNDILHRLPAPCWVEGRVALLGDAAHPMTPTTWARAPARRSRTQ